VDGSLLVLVVEEPELMILIGCSKTFLLKGGSNFCALDNCHSTTILMQERLEPNGVRRKGFVWFREVERGYIFSPK
jgi:hypothetical protein